jgi:nitroreductase
MTETSNSNLEGGAALRCFARHLQQGAAQKTGFIPSASEKRFKSRDRRGQDLLTPAAKPASSVQIQRPITSQRQPGRSRRAQLPLQDDQLLKVVKPLARDRWTCLRQVRPKSGGTLVLAAAVVQRMWLEHCTAESRTIADASWFIITWPLEKRKSSLEQAELPVPRLRWSLGVKNIVGRMDLSRVQNMQSGPSTRPTPSGGPGLAGIASRRIQCSQSTRGPEKSAGWVCSTADLHRGSRI